MRSWPSVAEVRCAGCAAAHCSATATTLALGVAPLWSGGAEGRRTRPSRGWRTQPSAAGWQGVPPGRGEGVAAAAAGAGRVAEGREGEARRARGGGGGGGGGGGAGGGGAPALRCPAGRKPATTHESGPPRRCAAQSLRSRLSAVLVATRPGAAHCCGSGSRFADAHVVHRPDTGPTPRCPPP
ncbi:twist-related protein 1-like [Schistocerca americana]|uniref:twist-related protein 1-like n=1 Tax=Schistocerca americana TaxID=7009 RepID=UPI001F4F13C0|nr:twist-related protein 1-like [Schistocerca americana]